MNKPDENGFMKWDSTKPRMSLIPPKAMVGLAEVMTYGAVKYAPRNWHLIGDDWKDRYTSAALRHIVASLDGERNDPESGLSHMKHALACLAFLVELEEDREP